MPWPLSNRYLMIHLQINTDSLQRFLTITGKNDESLSFPNIPGMVKVPHYKAVWKVTMPTARTLHIEYILELNPGGTIPAWISNSYIDKGPYGTFSNLAELLKK